MTQAHFHDTSQTKPSAAQSAHSLSPSAAAPTASFTAVPAVFSAAPSEPELASRPIPTTANRRAFRSVNTFGSRTDVGLVREQNEDSLIVAPPLYVVADGMGGHAAGEVASEIAVTTILECAPKQVDAEDLGQAVQTANREIINAALSGLGREGMGTTCTAAMMKEKRLVIAQVGDSRAYLLHQGHLIQLTRDHSLMAEMIEQGRITPEEARYHPQRSVITRALGNDASTLPDLYEIEVEETDVLLLCSDGLTSMLTDKAIEDIMKHHLDAQECANALVNEALRLGGLDNVTVIVVHAEGSSKARNRKITFKTKATLVGVVILLLAFLGLSAWGVFSYLHNCAYLAENEEGYVALYQGTPDSFMGLGYSQLIETSDVLVSKLSPSAAQSIKEGMRTGSLEEAQELLDSYRTQIAASEKSKTAGDNNASEASDSSNTAGDTLGDTTGDAA